MTSELKPDLSSFGYADGGYMSKCSHCKETFLGAKRAWACEPCAIKKSLEPKIEQAKPEVSELVRYSDSNIMWNADGPGDRHSSKDGRFVKYDQAIKIIAAKDSELALKDTGLKIAMSKIAALEAKLAQIEKQEAVAYRYRFITTVPPQRDWSDWFIVDDGQSVPQRDQDQQEVQSLYTAPVASDADLRAETIRLCANEIKGLRRLLNAQTVALDISREDAIYKICEDAIRALNPSEPRT